MADPTKQELQALAWAVASWARCLPPMTRDRHPNRAIAEAHDKVRAARVALKKLRTRGVGAVAEEEAVERDGCDPTLLGKRIGYYPDGKPFGYITEQERVDALATDGVGEAFYQVVRTSETKPK